MEASDNINHEDEPGKTVEHTVEEFMDTLEGFSLITEPAKVTNNSLDELEEALEILKSVDTTVTTLPLMDTSVENMELLSI